MSTDSPLLKLTLQALDENPDTWGQILNDSAIQLLEDAIAGAATITLVAATDYTLDDTAGGPTAADGSRYMILAVGGTPGGATNIIVPTRSKVYLAVNNSGENLTFKTVAGTGPTIPDGEGQWIFCNGTDVLAASAATATTAGTATTATDADALIGVAGAEYAQKALQQTWTAGQVITRAAALTEVTGQITPNIADSDSFYAVWAGNYQLNAPSGSPQNGQRFSIVIQQDGTGSRTISFQSNTYIFEGGNAPVLSTAINAVDYLAFEYCTNLAVTGARWIGSILKGVA